MIIFATWRRCLFVSTIIFISIIAGYIISEGGVFLQKKISFDDVLAKTQVVDDRSSQDFAQLVNISLRGSSVSFVVGRSLLAQSEGANSRAIVWAADSLLWQEFVRLFYTENERIELFYLLSFNGIDFGVDNLACRMFRKKFKDLSLIELATVVAVLEAPHKYNDNPALATVRARELVRALADGRSR